MWEHFAAGLRSEGDAGSHLVQLPAEAGLPRAACLALCPNGF